MLWVEGILIGCCLASVLGQIGEILYAACMSFMLLDVELQCWKDSICLRPAAPDIVVAVALLLAFGAAEFCLPLLKKAFWNLAS